MKNNHTWEKISYNKTSIISEAKMKETAIEFYSGDYNCSQCILKAAETVYGIDTGQSCMDMCSAVNVGFGVGCICCAVIACVMVLGSLFDKETAVRLRMRFLSELYSTKSSLNCSSLKQTSCEELIGFMSETLERIIIEEKGISKN